MTSSNDLDAADRLDQATDILQFVMDVSPAFAADGSSCITASGANGLAHVLDNVTDLIRQARLLI
jgi:hypothetical protein